MEPDETLHGRASENGAARPATTASTAAGADTVRAGAAGPDAARRNFLKAAPLGALAVVAGAAQAGQAPPAPVAAAQAPQPRGYHETEHIRRYYQTAAYW